MSIRGRFFAAVYDRMLAKVEAAGLADQRAALVGLAGGDVLEVGAGTGANLRYYRQDVTSLVVLEPEPAMLKRLQRTIRRERPLARALRAPAEDLPFDDDSFDTIVCTLVLCTVADQPRALREMHRVLRPGGQLLFVEHVRSEYAKRARLQDRMNWLNQIVAGGCNCNRRTTDTINAAGFLITRLEHSELKKAPPFVRPLVIGTALVSS